jgi:hypothetical protein
MSKKMEESQVKSIVSQEITNALGYMGKLPQQRTDAFRLYMGEPLGNEQPGRSKVVMHDAQDAVEWIVPPLVKVFMGSTNPIEFNPQSPNDEQESKIVTEYVNYVLTRKNDGYHIIRTWIKDALISKNAFLKIYRDTRKTETYEKYENLSQLAYDALLAQEGVEEVDVEIIEPTPTALDLIDPSTAEQGIAPLGVFQTDQEPTYNVKIKKVNKEGYTRIEPVPPEQMLISRRAVTLEDAQFICHRVQRTKTDLLEMGYSKSVVDKINSDNSQEFNQERIERFQTDDEFPFTSRTDEPIQSVWVNECYIRIDENGDGKAELRKITVAGDNNPVILDDEECDGIPFVSWCPCPIPHKFFGLSIVDQVADLQILRTTLVRGILDNIYLSLAPRIAYRKGSVEFNDLANHRPGAPIACEGDPASSVQPIAIPFTGAATFPVLQYTDTLLENRTGVNDAMQGQNPDTLQNQTATAANIQSNMAQQKIELITRELAEGFKKLALKIYELECKYQDKEISIQLDGQWMPINPSNWKTQYSVNVNVGLGTGSKDQALAHLQTILGIQVQAITQQGGVNGPLVNLQNVFTTVSKIAENAGFKNAEQFFSDPRKSPPNPQASQKPDPNMVLAQAQAQSLQAKAQNDQQKLQLEAQKMQQEHELKLQELQQKAQLEMAQLQQKAQLEREKMQMDVQIKMQQMNLEGQVKGAEIGANIAIEHSKMEMPQVSIGGETV